jgi:sentrin-specific protease 1
LNDKITVQSFDDEKVLNAPLDSIFLAGTNELCYEINIKKTQELINSGVGVIHAWAHIDICETSSKKGKMSRVVKSNMIDADDDVNVEVVDNISDLSAELTFSSDASLMHLRETVYNTNMLDSKNKEKFNNFSPHLVIGVGSRVQLNINTATNLGLYNGAIGTVIKILYDEQEATQSDGKFYQPNCTSSGEAARIQPILPIVLVKLDYNNQIAPFESYGFSEHKMTNVVPIKPLTVILKSKINDQKISFTQLPLQPAWCMSIHRSQGLSLRYGFYVLGFIFARGLAYVARSRFTKLAGFTLIGGQGSSMKHKPETSLSDVKMNSHGKETLSICEEYCRLYDMLCAHSQQIYDSNDRSLEEYIFDDILRDAGGASALSGDVETYDAVSDHITTDFNTRCSAVLENDYTTVNLSDGKFIYSDAIVNIASRIGLQHNNQTKLMNDVEVLSTTHIKTKRKFDECLSESHSSVLVEDSSVIPMFRNYYMDYLNNHLKQNNFKYKVCSIQYNTKNLKSTNNELRFVTIADEYKCLLVTVPISSQSANCLFDSIIASCFCANIKLEKCMSNAGDLRKAAVTYFKSNLQSLVLDDFTFLALLQGYSAKDRCFYRQQVSELSCNSKLATTAKKLIRSCDRNPYKFSYSAPDNEYEIYAEYMSFETSFGDELMLSVCSQMLHLNITVVKSDQPNKLLQYRAVYPDDTIYNVVDGHTILLINDLNVHFYGTILKFDNKHNKYQIIDLIDDDKDNDDVNDCQADFVPPLFKPLLGGVGCTSNVSSSPPANKLQRTTFTDFALLRDVYLDNNIATLMSKRIADIDTGEIDHLKSIWNLEAQFYHDYVQVNSLSLLKPRKWLNDEIINAYLNILKDRDCKKAHLFHDNNLEYHKSYYASTHFYPKLTAYDEHTFKYDVDLKRWFHNPKFQFHLNDMDKIFIPVNITNEHWMLVVVFVAERKICFYDSMRMYSGKLYTQNILKWIEKECEIDRKPFCQSEWITLNNRNCPQQDNGTDCGLFLLMNVDVLSDSIPLHNTTYSANNMPHFRQKIACDIIRGNVLY